MIIGEKNTGQSFARLTQSEFTETYQVSRKYQVIYGADGPQVIRCMPSSTLGRFATELSDLWTCRSFTTRAQILESRIRAAQAKPVPSQEEVDAMAQQGIRLQRPDPLSNRIQFYPTSAEKAKKQATAEHSAESADALKLANQTAKQPVELS